MPNDPYLDASVAWRIRTGNLEFREADFRTTSQNIIESGMATEVKGLISTGKEADVYLAGYNDAPIAVKMYRLYRTSHRGGRPIKLDSAGRLAAHEFDMLYQAWKGGALVPTPAKRVENMLSMRYLGNELGTAPRLVDAELDDPETFMISVIQGIESLAKAGVVHSDLSPYNILVFEGRPWFIDLSEAIRVDRLGYSHWQRLDEAKKALEHGLRTIQDHFLKYGVTNRDDDFVERIISSLDRFNVRERPG
ncbi:MAG TPA: RIO1 family regulatory kinase/ATPase [Methanomassiliicoccales archaeon]|jgi:serine/threonine-protein kinase RIO1